MPSIPNQAAIVRLVGAVVLETNDEWAVARRYMSLAPRPRHRQSHRQAARPGILITWTSSKGGAPEPRAGVLSHQQDGGHYWARVLMDLGHDVRLISPQFVTPYVKSNKNDRNDAEAICEAVGRPSMRFVPPKTAEQLEIQAVHRIRQRLVSDRTRLVNRIRGLLAEQGGVIGRDISCLRRALAQIAGGATDGLGAVIRELVCDVREELHDLDQRIAVYNRRIREIYRGNEMCQRTGTIEGIGPITAATLVAAVGSRSCFKNGRQFAAWPGLGPRQRSSGGKSRLFGIGKRGGRYLRTLMIHGARAVLGKAHGKKDPRSQWIGRMRERRHPNIVAVALANKNARVVWPILSRGESYRPAEIVLPG